MFGINMILPDIPRIYTALAEFLACFLCVLEIRPKISYFKLAAVSVMVFLLQVLFLTLTNGLDGVLWIVCMLIAIAIMYFYIYICCDISAKDTGYYCVRAFATAEFAAALEWQIFCFFIVHMGWNGIQFRIICLILVYSIVYFVVWILYNKDSYCKKEYRVTDKELFAYIIIGLAVFSISNLGFLSFDKIVNGSRSMEIFNVRTLVDLSGIIIMYAYYMQRMDLRTRMELESVQNILHNQYIQYQQSKEAIDIINYKYHDLKHYIIALRAEINSKEINEYLDKMERDVQRYEVQNETGNAVLDTLLTSKRIQCQNHDITLTCVLDGTRFDFIDTMDICSIFGNALDNAIECEKKIHEKEKRLIHVNSFIQKSFLIIRFENYYEGCLQFEDNLPITTKNEKMFHGYGLRSLRYSVHKYEGEIDINTKNNWFNLKILFPMQERAERWE